MEEKEKCMCGEDTGVNKDYRPTEADDESMEGGWPWMPIGAKMAGAIEDLSASAYGTSEVKVLFEDWSKAVEEEILSFVREKGSCNPAEIASKLKISEDSAGIFICRLIRSGQIKITTLAVKT